MCSEPSEFCRGFIFLLVLFGPYVVLLIIPLVIRDLMEHRQRSLDDWWS